MLPLLIPTYQQPHVCMHTFCSPNPLPANLRPIPATIKLIEASLINKPENGQSRLHKGGQSNGHTHRTRTCLWDRSEWFESSKFVVIPFTRSVLSFLNWLTHCFTFNVGKGMGNGMCEWKNGQSAASLIAYWMHSMRLLYVHLMFC